MNRFFYLIVLFLIITCQHNTSDYKRIEQFFLKQNINIENYKSIVVINEKGTCINCNNKFSKLMSKFIDRDDVLFLVSTSGIMVDISYYLTKENNQNIVIDFSDEFSKLNLVEHCAIINLENKDIDTIIQIDISNVDQSNDFLINPFKKSYSN